jgi:hypothetical protein
MAADPKHPLEAPVVAFCIIAALLLFYGFSTLNWSLQIH